MKSVTKPTPFRLETDIPHCRTIWIGVLEGTWRDMGIQYGQRAGRDIAYNFDFLWKNSMETEFDPWKQGKTESERQDYSIAYMERAMQELSFLSPELTEFLTGIAEGAAIELDRCQYAGVCPHVLKIAILNWGHLPLHPNWDFSRDRPKPRAALGREKKVTKAGGHDCCGFWIKGEGTRTGETYAARAVQMWSVDPVWSFNQRQVAYVAIPKDPKARVFWGHSKAGSLGGLGGGLLNDLGLCVLTAGCSYSSEHWDQVDDTCAPGVRDFLLATYGVIFSKTPEEAAERITVGTPEYRKLTGRKTVLRARGANIVFANAESAVCVEQTARHYAIRKPGDLDEKGGNYIVIANHFKCPGSFDENNAYHPDQPITRYQTEREKSDETFGTYYRFWSGMWMLRNDYGKIDRDMIMRELSTSHVGYDKAGNRYDPDPETGVPTVPGTFCCHMQPMTKEHPLGTGGNIETSVFNLSTREVWWVPVWPCHYKERNMDWDYLNLKPFSKYRQMLWGYQ